MTRVRDSEIDRIFGEFCAITDTAFKGVAKQLEFAINGETKAVDVAKLKEAGYTVEYQATVEASRNADGKITADDNFKYNIIVTKDEETFETGMTDVKVINKIDPAKITKVAVKQGEKEVNTVIVGKGIKLEVKEYVNNGGKTVKVDNSNLAPDIKLVSKDLDKVIVSKDGSLQAVQAGKATVEMTKKGMETYVVELNIASEARKATTIEGFEDLSLSVDAHGIGESKTLNLVVKDQYGDKMSETVVLKSKDVEVVKVENDTVTATGEGTTKVTLSVGDKELASFNVTVKEAGEIATYHLEVQEGKGTVLDLNTENEDDTPEKINVKFVGRDKDGLFVKEVRENVKIKSSKDSVVTYSDQGLVTAMDVGKAKIVATITEGTLVTEKQELEIEVVNTSKPKIEIIELGDKLIATDNIYTINYDKAEAIGNAKVTFSQDVMISVTIDGKEITKEQKAAIMSLTGVNLYETVAKEGIKADLSGVKYGNIEEISGNFNVEVELTNGSGYTETFTFKFVEADAE